MERYGNTVPHLRYPKRNFRLAETGDDLRLAIPAYLAVELYRTGILPRDADIPVKIRIDGRPAAWFTLRAVYYPDRTDGPFPAVNFTFTRVWEEHRRRAARLVETLGETTAEEQQQIRAGSQASDRAELQAAEPLDDDDAEQVSAAVSRLLGAPIALDVQINPALIGGVCLNLGGRVWDASLDELTAPAGGELSHV